MKAKKKSDKTRTTFWDSMNEGGVAGTFEPHPHVAAALTTHEREIAAEATHTERKRCAGMAEDLAELLRGGNRKKAAAELQMLAADIINGRESLHSLSTTKKRK